MLASTQIVGRWGPIQQVYYIPGSQNHISEGEMLDGTTNCRHLLYKQAFILVFGSRNWIRNISWTVHREYNSRHYFHQNNNESRTEFFIRGGLPAIVRGLQTTRNLQTVATATTITRKTGTSTLSDTNKEILRQEFEAVKPKPPSLWYYRNKAIYYRLCFHKLYTRIWHIHS